MFKIKTNQEIGEYLNYLISKKYSSTRKFCKDYLRLDKRPIDDEEIRKMANRMSQIIKGVKAIQTYDLPIFTELLEVTCEQIYAFDYVMNDKYDNNYFYDASATDSGIGSLLKIKQAANVFKVKGDTENKLILNPDEYDKTLIDYAIEAGNYKLIKYLIDKKYIWFVDNEHNHTYFYKTFGAGTSIERRKLGSHDLLQYKLDSEDNLRMTV